MTWFSYAVEGVAREKDFLDSVQSLCTIAAIIFGAFWAWRRFGKERPFEPSLFIDISPVSFLIDSHTRLLHIQALVKNVGRAAFRVKDLNCDKTPSWVRVYGITQAVVTHGEPLPKLLDWALSNEVQLLFNGWFKDTPDWCLEGGECEPASLDMVIPATIRIIHIWIRISGSDFYWSAHKTVDVLGPACPKHPSEPEGG